MRLVQPQLGGQPQSSHWLEGRGHTVHHDCWRVCGVVVVILSWADISQKCLLYLKKGIYNPYRETCGYTESLITMCF